MAIYRGAGGSGDATGDAANASALALASANEAAASATSAAASATTASNAAASTAGNVAAAATSATNAATSATNAASSATNASSSASSASTSASTATTKASEASTSATNAASSASGAATSATNSATSATSASGSASTATTQATNAAASATSALGSASTATTQAGIATTKASEANTSATNAATSATTASTQATNAASSASSASTSATTATTQASNASASATNAATSATNAASSATSASNSATTATTQATNAAASATSAAASYDSFDDRYLGAKSSAPTLDNDGNALLTGALYFNTVDNAMKVWSGSAWLNAYASLSGALLASNNLSDLTNTATARSNLGLGTLATQSGTFSGTSSGTNTGDQTNISGNAATATTATNLSGGSVAATTISASGVSTFSAGTAGAPAITTTGDTNTGIFFPAADTIAFSEGGTESMRIDASGNLGLGVTPSAWSQGKAVEIGVIGNSLWGNTSADFQMTQNAYFNSGWKYANSGTGASRFAQGGGSYAWLIAPSGTAGTAITFTQAMTLDASGNLGIGTASPSVKLHVAGTGTQSALVQSTNGGTTNLRLLSSTAVEWIVENSTGGLKFIQDATERMRIDSSGKVAVGFAGFSSGAQGYLEVQGDAASVRNLIATNNTASGTASNGFVAFSRNGTFTGGISNTGTTTAFNTSSDYRLKDNVAPMTNALATVALLKPVTYTWKADGTAGQGFIAHELQAVVPDAVTGEKDAVNEDGSIKSQGIDTSYLVATLTAAIQEQQALIENLTTRIAVLEAK